MTEKHMIEKIKERAERALDIAFDAKNAKDAAIQSISSLDHILGICIGYLEGRKEEER